MDTRTRLTLPSIHPRSALTSNRRHLARRVKPRTLDHAPCEKMCVRYFGRFIALLADAHAPLSCGCRSEPPHDFACASLVANDVDAIDVGGCETRRIALARRPRG